MGVSVCELVCGSQCEGVSALEVVFGSQCV